MGDLISYRAVAKYLPISSHKVRAVARCIRLCPSCERALAVLNAMPHKGAALIKKVLKSAVSNAVNCDGQLKKSDLVIERLLINKGPQSKRVWARSRGRADRLIKRSTHIVVIVKKGWEG